MKKQLILNNNPYCQTDREDLISYYESLGCIEIPVLYNGNFVNALWNGSEFIEGASQEEIEIETQRRIKEYDVAIFQLTEDLYISGKKRVLGKVGRPLSDNTLNIIKEDYIRREIVANEIINDLESSLIFTKNSIIQDSEEDYTESELDTNLQGLVYICNQLQNLDPSFSQVFPTPEMSKLKKYAYFIVISSEIGKKSNEIMEQLIGHFRSRLATFLNKREFDKIEEGFYLVKTITPDTDLVGILGIYNQFNLI